MVTLKLNEIDLCKIYKVQITEIESFPFLIFKCSPKLQIWLNQKFLNLISKDFEYYLWTWKFKFWKFWMNQISSFGEHLKISNGEYSIPLIWTLRQISWLKRDLGIRSFDPQIWRPALDLTERSLSRTLRYIGFSQFHYFTYLTGSQHASGFCKYE